MSATVGPEALGRPNDLLSTALWQHEWKDLVRYNPLMTTEDMALDGHGVDSQLVDHIEAQKDQNIATLRRFVSSTP